jgi:hypothetical protein
MFSMREQRKVERIRYIDQRMQRVGGNLARYGGTCLYNNTGEDEVEES